MAEPALFALTSESTWEYEELRVTPLLPALTLRLADRASSSSEDSERSPPSSAPCPRRGSGAVVDIRLRSLVDWLPNPPDPPDPPELLVESLRLRRPASLRLVLVAADVLAPVAALFAVWLLTAVEAVDDCERADRGVESGCEPSVTPSVAELRPVDSVWLLTAVE
jgi:hypothetical protein